MESTLYFIIEVIGTLAFAVSGIRLAARKRFDWFGAYTVGVVTAIGGGTIRDLLLGAPVFWMASWMYLAVTGLAFAIVVMFKRVLTSDSRSLFMFDAVGLALFVITGIQKSLAYGFPMWVAMIMGMITGSFGGVLRDVLINEEPLFFRKDIYATACLGGGLVYWLVEAAGGSAIVQQICCATVILFLRWGALHYGWHLPEMKER
ncbi:MAG: trimeric intracellular cation channel family protein [Duncaniella sp.]|nr:trimeric intracellular cation channel family protein [Duncaniella sp.]MDE5918659.1 trimeric intracellular cation channel family protein [Duncaniella sp.]MDE6327255.1 trimeric intracellular cation channel family protein [Duncaniella sp.]MDE6572889.1 trimeric intracellular cation channel family protein [Duncaniella sp.]